MQITCLRVQNYRALRELEIPLSRFGCLIGKNNAGKSTVLQAVSLFFSGSKLSGDDFFDPSLPIRIEMQFDGIDDKFLERIALDDHRTRIASIVQNGTLTLVRKYDTTGASKLMHVALAPKDDRFRADQVDLLVKGKQKKALVDAVVGCFPELDGKLAANITQAKVREEIESFASKLPSDQKHLADCNLPTGLDESIEPLLPEPIYIPAVKNLSDDVKATQSTPFGKVLGILLRSIEPELGDVKTLFSDLSKKFNRIVTAEGQVVDERLDDVKTIERTVEGYLKESFANVSLEMNVPPPELKTLLSSARIPIDDGVKGEIETKGDGLRRAAVFAILRAYVKLSRPGGLKDTALDSTDKHILLFEEPELYLHPGAQKILFEALRVFSLSNHVLITTHSPNFFGPEGTASFIKLAKRDDKTIAQKPFTSAHPINMKDLSEKTQFQLICHERNNAAFFSETVVLVEGDSDHIVFPHVAGVLVPERRTAGSSCMFVRVNGKAQIKRNREFFSRFGVRIVVITDLDLITNGFDGVGPNEEMKRSHSVLISLLDKSIQSGNGFAAPATKAVSKAHEKTELRGLWKAVKDRWEEAKADHSKFPAVEDAVEKFFEWEKRNDRLALLKTSTDQAIVKAKSDLLSLLRMMDVFILERGEIEDYYPATTQGGDKPSKAQHFCNSLQERAHFDAWSSAACIDGGDGLRKEMIAICDGIYAGC